MSDQGPASMSEDDGQPSASNQGPRSMSQDDDQPSASNQGPRSMSEDDDQPSASNQGSPCMSDDDDPPSASIIPQELPPTGNNDDEDDLPSPPLAVEELPPPPVHVQRRRLRPRLTDTAKQVETENLINIQLIVPQQFREDLRTLSTWFDLKMTDDRSMDAFIVADFTGWKKGAYANGVWRVKVTIPTGYPEQYPDIVFLDKIFHPNIHFEGGLVSREVLRNIWNPRLYDLSTLFIRFLPKLLLRPIHGGVELMNTNAAELWISDTNGYEIEVGKSATGNADEARRKREKRSCRSNRGGGDGNI